MAVGLRAHPGHEQVAGAQAARVAVHAIDAHGAIADEHARTLAWHRRITGASSPLADNPLLERRLRIRYPSLDPLHVMQVDLLRRFREGDDDELVVRGIQLSINAIATGLRNSG